jgi:hypothetical protein
VTLRPVGISSTAVLESYFRGEAVSAVATVVAVARKTVAYRMACLHRTLWETDFPMPNVGVTVERMAKRECKNRRTAAAGIAV